MQQLETAQASALSGLTQPVAVSARYDVTTEMVVIKFRSGAIFSFPAAIAQGLTEASTEDLQAVEVAPSGSGLHWEALDADLHVPSLLSGVFGTRKWMEQLHTRWQ